MPSQHYILAYSVLPAIAKHLGSQILLELLDTAFLNKLWDLAGSELPENKRRAAGVFHTYPHCIAERTFLNVIEFPPPSKPPEACYAGVVIRYTGPDDDSEFEMRYFTLELGDDLSGLSPSTTYFCEPTEKEHVNYGEWRMGSPEEFAGAIVEFFQGQQTPDTG